MLWQVLNNMQPSLH